MASIYRIDAEGNFVKGFFENLDSPHPMMEEEEKEEKEGSVNGFTYWKKHLHIFSQSFYVVFC